MPNHLINEKSPYLLQHAYNPVDWYPWGAEAFEKAEDEDKPIFLSIGYSSCHWCHVMAHESFENPEVASLLNENFVLIKVDREERPDIDKIYMDVCQAMTGSGGWPLTIIMTPDKRPFFAATYLPKLGRFGHIGLLELIPQIKDYWQNRRQEVLSSAEKVSQAFQKSTSAKEFQGSDREILERTYTQLAERFDAKDGGFSEAPKFPTPHILLFLLRYWKRTGNAYALQMVQKTLQMMRHGGIFDQIGFGFHRYSTDFFWLVPHFEKMLYDQALLAIAYLEAFQAVKDEEYARTAREILDYVSRVMTAPEGGFYSAEDADSEDKEGMPREGEFYLWQEAELKTILEEEELNLAISVFNIKKNGNFLEQGTQNRTGKNILHFTHSIPELASELNLNPLELKEKIESIRKKLFKVREQRTHPQKDDKILTDWNGIMIAAFAKAAQVFNEPKYVEACRSALSFILGTMSGADGRLLHRYRNGEAAILANLDDYAFLIWALLETYESTFEANYLQIALDLTSQMLDLFWDAQEGGFYFTPQDGEPLLFRSKDIYDGALPSGNSVAMLDLLYLEEITGNAEFGEKAMRIWQNFSSQIAMSPAAFTHLMCALEFAIGPSFHVVIAGDPLSDDTQLMVKALRTQFIPNKVVLLNPITEESPQIHHIAPNIQSQKSLHEKATAYICIKNVCKRPVSDVDAMLKELEVNQNSAII